MLNFITWNPDPSIFAAGGFAIRWYGLLFALGFVFSYMIMARYFKKENLSEKSLDVLALYIVIGTVVGARLGHCLFYEPGYYLSHPLAMITPWSGTIGGENFQFGLQGLASHGGAIGVLLAIIIWARKKKVPLLWILDRIAIVVALTGTLIRLGNLMNSEIVGQAANVPWAFIFAKVDQIPRHPAQLYESLAYLAIFTGLFFYHYKNQKHITNGTIFGWFLILLFGARFLIEFLKPQQTEIVANMSLNMGHLLSIPFIIGGIILVWWARTNGTIPPIPLKAKKPVK